jgi:hypothetical protein
MLETVKTKTMKTNYSNLGGYAKSADGVSASVLISKTIEIVDQTKSSSFKQKPYSFSQRAAKFVGFLAFCVLMLQNVAFGQVSVTATAGTVGPTAYTTVNAAFTAINAGTHKGVIAISITANTTEPATPVPLLLSGGTSLYTSISIKPVGNRVINSNAAPVTNRGIIELAGADNVTIDGDDPGTAGTQNLSIVSVASATAGIACIRLSSNSITGTDGASNNTIKNCIITGSRNSATSTVVNYGIQFSNGIAASAVGTGAYSSLNTIISDNTITRCYYGVHAIGTSATYPNTGTQILRNTIGNATSANNVGFRGILISYSATTGTGALIQGNDIRVGDYSTTGYLATVSGIEIGAANYNFIVNANHIHDVYNQTTSGYGAYGLTISSATNNTLGTITNNFIRDMVASKYLTTTTIYINHGIYISAAATGLKIDGNTIVLNTPNTTGATANEFSSCLTTATTCTFTSMRNNIFVNNLVSTNAYGVYFSATTVISGATVNNNNYYAPTGKIGFYTAAQATLASWKTATAKDANAINVNPPFVSATDLHINTAGTGVSSFFYTGASGTGNTVDYDNQTRATNPCIGADEFTLPVACTTPTAPTNNATGVSQAATLSWAAATNATSYDVYFGTDAAATNIVNGVNQAGTTYTPVSLSASTTYYWKIVPKNPGSTATGCTIWQFTTGAAVPTLATGSLTAFGNSCVNIASAANSFTVTGINLTGNLTVGALSGYSYSTTVGGTYTSTLTLTPTSGSVSTTVFVKFTPTSAIAFTGNIAVSGGGATTQNVAASGTGVDPMGGTYTVGATGNYATLTAAVAAYNSAICFNANVIFSLIDATYSASETFPISINVNPNIGAYTLTVKPAASNNATMTGSVASLSLIHI